MSLQQHEGRGRRRASNICPWEATILISKDAYFERMPGGIEQRIILSQAEVTDTEKTD